MHTPGGDVQPKDSHEYERKSPLDQDLFNHFSKFNVYDSYPLA